MVSIRTYINDETYSPPKEAIDRHGIHRQVSQSSTVIPERSRQQTGTIRSKRIKRRKGRARLSLLLLLFLVILLVVFIAKIFIPPPIKASSAILIHADTGRVLYAMHADLPFLRQACPK